MDEYIGSIVKRLVKERGLTLKEFAALIHVHPKTVPNIYKRKYFHTKLLIKLMLVLDYDFPEHIYADEELAEFRQKKEAFRRKVVQDLQDKVAAKDCLISELKKTIELERKMYEAILSRG